MAIKFKVKPGMIGGPKHTLDPKPEMEAAPGGSEPVFQIKDFAQNHVMYHVHKKIAGPRKARHHNVIHISDLDPERNWCPREAALLTFHKMKRPSEYLGTAQSLVFRMGNKGADLVIESLPPEMVWGNWRCRACSVKTEHCYTPHACPNCGAKREALSYREVLFIDPNTGIVGSMDLFVDLLGNGMKTGVEIKTEGNDSFGKRTKPEFSHEWRTKGYMWLFDTSGKGAKYSINMQEARVVYITKEGYKPEPKIKEWGLPDAAKSPFKEYTVNRDDSALENKLDMVDAYKTWMVDYDHGHLAKLPARIKDSQHATPCKGCPVKTQCWSGPEWL